MPPNILPVSSLYNKGNKNINSKRYSEHYFVKLIHFYLDTILSDLSFLPNPGVYLRTNKHSEHVGNAEHLEL